MPSSTPSLTITAASSLSLQIMHLRNRQNFCVAMKNLFLFKEALSSRYQEDIL